MTLTELRYFVALAEIRNFSQVAKQNYVAQAAVSYQIRTLEQELGVKLFERSTRSVKLTPLGRSFYIDVQPILASLEEACNKMKNRSLKTKFTIGYSRVCFGEKFKQMIDILTQQYENVDFILEVAEPENDLFQRIQSGEIDTALFFNPYSSPPDDLDCLKFGRRRVMVVSERHRYADLSSIAEDDIPIDEVLACEGMRKIEQLGVVNEQGGKDNQTILLRDMESVLAMVQSGRGITCLPIIDDVSITGLRYIPIVDTLHTDDGPELCLAWNNGSDSPLLRSCRDVAKKMFGRNYSVH